MTKIKKQEALDYHSEGKPGKIEVVPTKRSSSQRDLSLAYSPGVAEPCLAIEKNKADVYKYTAKGNLVAVISNGTAVLGLGNIGPEASKPVMEGKGVLFKVFAGIDVFDIEVDATDVDTFVNTVKAIAPTFGGINLEDIKAPECFEIERRLKEELNIPVMHDDQHGTAIISAAALLNALELTKRKLSRTRIVINGAGAAAISCARLYISLGANPENIVMCDSKGVIRVGREDLTETKIEFATKRKLTTLDEAIQKAHVFIGLSKGNVVSKNMLLSMEKRPIVFALANPDPEISYKDAIAARADIIMATGRSDHPNQVNNVLGFPFIFRGALDVKATTINEEMKIAAVHAIADMAKEVVPDEVNAAYENNKLSFGKDYIIPKPFDPRLITVVAPAVAKAAMDSGVAQEPILDWGKYEIELNKRLGLDNKLLRQITIKAKRNPKRVVFAEADNYKILKAAHIVSEEGIAKPILLGRRDKIEAICEEHGLDISSAEIIDPKSDEEKARREDFGAKFWEKRKRKGLTHYEAVKAMRDRNHFGLMMVESNQADALISGLTRNYPSTIRPALQIIGTAEGVNRVAGAYIIMTKNGPVFFADTTVNVSPTAQNLADIASITSGLVRQFGYKPHVAMLSYSNFGSTDDVDTRRVAEAVEILHKSEPKLIVDGEIQANFALDPDLLKEVFPFSNLVGNQANTFIFPSLESGNIAYKMVQGLTNMEIIGPVLTGLKKSVHVLPLGSGVNEIVNMVTIAVADAQYKK
ncbi:MAG: malate dehydrogenase (oxaloacetate-decarboxylating)(NADP+) [Candidatus Azotimanducaceae bacterium]|jgi:malate dehydrogenase (oxaloacetate-decarboxylating)(NADP+)